MQFHGEDGLGDQPAAGPAAASITLQATKGCCRAAGSGLFSCPTQIPGLDVHLA